ncbi:hypothetical protein [Prevotella melaninogenica]|uniref:Uncharacterized protein n=1 Tax=Prevotella melaninogenica TaxID=28132 RepID=A0A7D4FVT7_9BACT|nr:hypothetical protein [Prevotella melaninogenica]QKH87892.1 hypothetical protein FIU21_02580 [Prevotella melaninogenica]
MTYSIHSNDYKVPLLLSSPNVSMLSTHRADGKHQWCQVLKDCDKAT